MSSTVEQLTICILNKNEEERLPKAVLSVAALGARLLVVDAFSDDESFLAAKETWIESGRDLKHFEFVAQKWRGFVKSRESSFKLVKTRWVMWLDSDEWIEEDLRKWIQAHLEYLDPEHVYAFRRRSYFKAKAVKYGGWYPDFKVRLCRVGHAQWVSGKAGADLHERLVPNSKSGRTVRIDMHLGHLPFRNVAEQAETNATYSGLLAAAMAEAWVADNRKPDSKMLQYFKVGIKFLENYFWKLGFLDGGVGFQIAKGSAYSAKRCLEKARDLYWIRQK